MKTMAYNRNRLIVVAAGAIASLLIGFTLTPTFAALVASIQNSTNTANTGTLTMKETSGSASCNSFDSNSTNTATCSTINKYGGVTLVPGGAAKETNLSIQNTGSMQATSFTLTPGACTQSAVGGSSFSGSATDLCDKIKVKITSGASIIFDGSAKAFQTGGAINVLAKLSKTGVNPSESIPIKVAVSLDSSAGPTYQGLQISQPMTWTFSA